MDCKLKEGVYRTPDHRFENLADYPFLPHYTCVDGLRIHYLDEGPADGPVVVMVHGEPTWSYLYRHMIPHFTQEGFRVIVPDLVGFGKSDKPANSKFFSYGKNETLLTTLLFHNLQIRSMHLVAHDWGGLISLRIVARFPDRFLTVTAMNTAFPRLEGFNPVFFLWRLVSQVITFVPFSRLIPLGVRSGTAKEAMKAYDAPFPGGKYKTAPKVFPLLVPVFPWEQEAKTNRLLWTRLCNYNRPFLTVFSDKDPFTKKVEEDFIVHIRGAARQPHLKVKGAGHFLQEDEPETISKHILGFLAKSGNS